MAETNKTPAPKATDPKTNDTAPGEAAGGAKTLKVKATSAFLVFDPFTLDYVGEAGGEMRDTEFVQNAIKDGKLKEM